MVCSYGEGLVTSNGYLRIVKTMKVNSGVEHSDCESQGTLMYDLS